MEKTSDIIRKVNRKKYFFNSPKKREIGEQWTETDEKGETVYCEQKSGYIVRTYDDPNEKIDTSFLWKFDRCPKEVCTGNIGNRLDKTFQFKTGMCAKCTAEHQDMLRATGKFEEYEKSYMLDKAKSIFKETDQAVEETIAPLLKGYTEYVEEDGSVTKIAEVPPGLVEKIKEEYDEYKREVFDTIRQ